MSKKWRNDGDEELFIPGTRKKVDLLKAEIIVEIEEYQKESNNIIDELAMEQWTDSVGYCLFCHEDTIKGKHSVDCLHNRARKLLIKMGLMDG